MGSAGTAEPIDQERCDEEHLPVFAQAAEPISISRLRQLFRFHYDGTDHDPYLHQNPKEVYRPVSIFRTTQTHLLQVRPELPQAIGCVNYVALGMADLSVFLPLYEGIRSYPKAYTKGTNESSHESAYWKFRKVQALGMVDYNRYAPIIKKGLRRLRSRDRPASARDGGAVSGYLPDAAIARTRPPASLLRPRPSLSPRGH